MILKSTLPNIPSGGYPIPLLSDASGSENDPDDEDDDILDALNAVSDEDDDMSNNGDEDNGDDNDSWEDLDVQEENLWINVWYFFFNFFYVSYAMPNWSWRYFLLNKTKQNMCK